MLYLLMAFSSFFVFTIERTYPWRNRILKLKDKDDYCAQEARWFQKKFASIEDANQKLKILSQTCPALLVEPTKSALKSAQATADLLVLYQVKLLDEIGIREQKVTFIRKTEEGRLLVATSYRDPPKNPCQLPSILIFNKLSENRLIIYRENWAGFDVLARNLQWIYANEEVVPL